MTNKTYTINKGIGRPITFKGLKAQYIWVLGGGVVGVMILFAILYISGVSPWLCMLLALGLGFLLITKTYRMSNKYGEFGLMKNRAKQHIPRDIRTFSRKGFIILKKDKYEKDIDRHTAHTRSSG